jgi:cholesterol oxidase
MLKPKRFPHPAPLKLQALEKSAAQLRKKVERPPIAITFTDGVNHVGVQQYACTQCGDCVTGCNFAAKNTLIMNYLPDAKSHGAEIYTEVSVCRIEEDGERWAVCYEMVGAGRERFAPPPMRVGARWVILAAGTLGSTEILLRSSQADPVGGAPGLSLSPALGTGFSSNGDVLAVCYNAEDPVEGIGFGRRRPSGREPVGPTITGIIDLRDRKETEEKLVIQEGALPGAMASFLPGLLAVVNMLVGRRFAPARDQQIGTQLHRWLRCLQTAYRGAVRSTQTFLVMAHDAAAGVMKLGPNGRLRIEWPRIARQPVYAAVAQRLKEASIPLGGSYVRNPVDLFAVHPLGGCRMGETAEDAVVNHEGGVFRGKAGRDTYQGLYVSDGSIIPCSLGVNPLLTISSLAERMCARLASNNRWNIDYALPSIHAAPLARPAGLWFTERPRPGIEFTERMSGWFSDPRASGLQAAIEMTLTVISDDLNRMLVEPRHEARLIGTVAAPVLSRRPMTVREGYFNFLQVDPDYVETRRMIYRMKVTSDTGRRYKVSGHKLIRNALPWQAWSDLTTLRLKIESDDAGPEVKHQVLLGVMRLSMGDLLRQLTTVRARHAHRFTELIDGPLRFLYNLWTTILNSYGRVLASPIVATPDIAARAWPVRPVPEPPVVIPTQDGSEVQLTRYRGDPRWPVILTPGLGVAASSYAAETIERNLVVYLRQRGHDIWLLDYRASPVFPASSKPFTIDDIALRDWPTAIDHVLQETKQERVQIMAHCVSSLAIIMALLGGAVARGKVRSIICSQVAAHPIVPPQTEFKVGGHLVNLLRCFGVRQVTAVFDPRSWRSWILDQVLRLYPTRERCNSPVCRRILFIFHESFHHGQLNTETHDSMWRWYGSANLTALKHLGGMIRKGHLIDAEGNEIYMDHVRENLNLPISLMSGRLNRAFLPDSTEATWKWLRSSGNDPRLYQRKEFADYGHMDCFVGRRAARDGVYEWIADELGRWRSS